VGSIIARVDADIRSGEDCYQIITRLIKDSIERFPELLVGYLGGAHKGACSGGISCARLQEVRFFLRGVAKGAGVCKAGACCKGNCSNSRGKEMPLLAVNHHYYRAASTGMGIYPTTQEQLRQKLEAIRSFGWKIGTQADILSCVADGEYVEKIAIITFDDGLKEQISAIKDLKAMGATAICYIPVGPLIERCVLDVHKLHMIRSVTNDEALAAVLDKDFGFSKHEFDEHLLEIQYRYDQPLSRRVKYFLNFSLSAEQRDDWITKQFEDSFGDETAACESLYMGADDLKFLAKSGSLGSHGYSHRPLARLSTHELKDELRRSHEVLKTLTGVAPIGVSYPYGGKSAVGETVFNEARESGYEYGFTMERGVNEWFSDPLSMKRIDTNDIEDWLNLGAK